MLFSMPIHTSIPAASGTSVGLLDPGLRTQERPAATAGPAVHSRVDQVSELERFHGVTKDLFGHDIPELAIVIPMFRETDRIARTIATLASSTLNRQGVRFLFVDDGSRDGTSVATFQAIRTHGLIDATVLCLPNNVGKGAALRAGFESARGQYVAFLDADLSLDPADVSRAFARLQVSDADILIGERVTDERHQPKFRKLASSAFRVMATSIVDVGVADPQCAMKIFRGAVGRALFADLVTDGYSFDVEILGRANAAGLRVEQMKVAWEHCGGSKVNPVSDGFRMMVELPRIRRVLRREARIARRSTAGQ